MHIELGELLSFIDDASDDELDELYAEMDRVGQGGDALRYLVAEIDRRKTKE